MQKPDSQFAPPSRRRTKLRGLSLRCGAAVEDVLLSAFVFSISLSVFRDLNLLLPRLVNLLVVASRDGVLVSVSVTSGGAVALVRRRNGRRSLTC